MTLDGLLGEEKETYIRRSLHQWRLIPRSSE